MIRHRTCRPHPPNSTSPAPLKCVETSAFPRTSVSCHPPFRGARARGLVRREDQGKANSRVSRPPCLLSHKTHVYISCAMDSCTPQPVSDSVGTGVGAGRMAVGLAGAAAAAATEGLQVLARKLLPMPAEWRALIVGLPARLGTGGYAASTVARYTRCVTKFLRWCHRRGQGRLRAEDVVDFLAWLRQQGYGNAVQRLHLSAIRTSLDRLHGQELTRGMSYVPRSARVPAASDSQVESLLRAASERDWLLVALLSRVGLRPGELANLRWREVDPFGVTVRVRRGRPKRPVLLRVPAGLAGRLRTLLCGVVDLDEHVFAGRTPGQGLSVRGIQAAVGRLSVRCSAQASCTALSAAAKTATATPDQRLSTTAIRDARLLPITRTTALRIARVRGPPAGGSETDGLADWVPTEHGVDGFPVRNLADASHM